MSIISILNKTLTTVTKENINTYIYDTSFSFEYIQETEIPEYIQKYGAKNTTFYETKDGENTRLVCAIPTDMHTGDSVTLTMHNYTVRAQEYDFFDFDYAERRIREDNSILIYNDGRDYAVANSRLRVEEVLTNLILTNKKITKQAIKKYRELFSIARIDWQENSEYSVICELLCESQDNFFRNNTIWESIGLFVYSFFCYNTTYYIISTEKYSDYMIDYYTSLYDDGFRFIITDDDSPEDIIGEFYTEKEAVDFLLGKGVSKEHINCAE